MDCGELPADADVKALAAADPADPYADFPEDMEEEKTQMRLIQVASDMRALGNKLFQEGKFAEAAGKYSKALRYLEEVPSDADTIMEDKYLLLMIPCRLNRAACNLKLGNKTAVVEDTTAVLNKEQSKPADRVKAYFRRAQVRRRASAGRAGHRRC